MVVLLAARADERQRQANAGQAGVQRAEGHLRRIAGTRADDPRYRPLAPDHRVAAEQPDADSKAPLDGGGKRARFFEVLTRIFALTAVLALVLGLRDTPLRPLPRTRQVVAPAADAKTAKLCVAVSSKGGGALGRARISVYAEQAGAKFVLAGEAVTDDDGKACIERVALGSVWVLADAT